MQTPRPTWRSRVWVGAVAALMALGLVFSSVGVGDATAGWVLVATAVAIASAVIVGAQRRVRAQRRRYEDALADWAAERAAQGERLRIASELHDLVSHGLGLITVRAAAALSVSGAEGERERAQALADVERVGRETTTELRRMLTVLRDRDSAPRLPTDSLADLPAIVALAARSGLAVELAIHEPGEVSAGVQVAVCAVVREALSNAARHCGPTSAHVSVGGEDGVVVVSVSDDGPREGWRAQPGAGHGLSALGGRIQALGGTLEAAPTGSGFRLVARIPDERRA